MTTQTEPPSGGFLSGTPLAPSWALQRDFRRGESVICCARRSVRSDRRVRPLRSTRPRRSPLLVL